MEDLTHDQLPAHPGFPARQDPVPTPENGLGLPRASEPDASILVVDDLEIEVRFLSTLLQSAGYHSILSETDPHRALHRIERSVPDLLVLDLHMPRMSGVELLEELRQRIPRQAFPPVLVITADQSPVTRRQALAAGARDFVSKPFDAVEVLLRIGNLLEVQRAHAQLTRRVREKTRELAETRDIALTTLAVLADSRDPETGRHLNRIASYCRVIASALLSRPDYPEVTEQFVEQIQRTSTLHDIGKVAIPDAILRKSGALTPDERSLMQEHARIGGDTLSRVIASYPKHTFLTMGAEIAYQHHERWDGAGYPCGLAGEEISLAARIVSIADAYDAITSNRPYESARPHREAVDRIARDAGTHFDPALIEVFLEVAGELDHLRLVGAPRELAAVTATACAGR